MANKIISGREAEENIKEGAKLLFATVSQTLGPRASEVGFFGPGDMAMSIHDGVEIARRVMTEDPAIYWSIRTILQSANATVASVGDGTTLTTILAYEIYYQAMQSIAAGVNPRSLVDELLKNKEILLKELETLAIKVTSEKQAIEVASVSAQDKKLGKEIGEIIYKLGVDAVVTTDISPTGETYLELQVGCQFENGYIDPIFITDQARMEATVEKPRILLSDMVLSDIRPMMPLLEQFQKQSIKELVIIAQNITGNALDSFGLTKYKGGMNLLVIRAPFAGQTQKDFLADIAVLTGGNVITQGRRFDTVQLAELGQAERVTSTETATIIVGGRGDKTKLTQRVEMLKTAMHEGVGKSDYEKEKIKERFAKLSNGIAVVKVGAPLEIEAKNWEERAKDAIKATLSALEDGYMPGGETIFLTIREKLDKSLSGKILYNALEKPFHVLLSNAGLKPDRFLEKIQKGLGVDVLDGQIKDMVKSGIIDPTAVGRESLKNAISAAIILFTTKTLIMPIVEKKHADTK